MCPTISVGSKKLLRLPLPLTKKRNEKHTRGVRFSSLDFVTLEKRVRANKKRTVKQITESASLMVVMIMTMLVMRHADDVFVVLLFWEEDM